MESKYRYHAKAVAVSGHISRPIEHDIGDLAKSELADGQGGYVSARLENHRVHEILSIGSAYTQVSGSEGPAGHFNTLTIATIEKLNVLDILTVDRIVARLVGLHCTEDFGTHPHPWIMPLGSTIEGLRIAGKPVSFEHPPGFHMDLADPPTYAAWKTARPTYECAGHAIPVPHFGTVTLCRLGLEAIQSGRAGHRLHRLAMLHLKLGSPVEADLLMAGSDQDGNPP